MGKFLSKLSCVGDQQRDTPEGARTLERRLSLDVAQRSFANQRSIEPQATSPEPQASVAAQITEGALASLDRHLRLKRPEMPRSSDGNYESSSRGPRDVATLTDFGGEGLDMSRISPPSDILAKYKLREEQYLRKLLVNPDINNKYLNGKSDEESIKGAIKKIKVDLDAHAKSIVEYAIDRGAMVFRRVELEHLSTILSDKVKPLPSWMDPNDEHRLKKDHAMYGESQHPLHAYLSLNENGHLPGVRAITQFGKAIVRMRMNDTYKRSKIAFDDSHYHYWKKDDEISIFPQPLDNPGRGVFPIATRDNTEGKAKIELGVEKWISASHNPFSIKSLGDISPYPEVQIFGEITRSHIDKVFFPRSIDRDEIKTILTSLEKHGLEYGFYETDE